MTFSMILPVLSDWHFLVDHGSYDRCKKIGKAFIFGESLHWGTTVTIDFNVKFELNQKFFGNYTELIFFSKMSIEAWIVRGIFWICMKVWRGWPVYNSKHLWPFCLHFVETHFLLAHHRWIQNTHLMLNCDSYLDMLRSCWKFSNPKKSV